MIDPSVYLRSFAWIRLECPQPPAPASVRLSRRSCPSASNQLGFAETHLITDLHTAPAGSSVRRSRTHSPPSSRPGRRKNQPARSVRQRHARPAACPIRPPDDACPDLARPAPTGYRPDPSRRRPDPQRRSTTPLPATAVDPSARAVLLQIRCINHRRRRSVRQLQQLAVRQRDRLLADDPENPSAKAATRRPFVGPPHVNRCPPSAIRQSLPAARRPLFALAVRWSLPSGKKVEHHQRCTPFGAPSAVGPTSVSQSMTSTVDPTSVSQSMTSAVSFISHQLISNGPHPTSVSQQ
ncbi:hypothetical protein ACLOJK_005505 [Asimina triloba]